MHAAVVVLAVLAAVDLAACGLLLTAVWVAHARQRRAAAAAGQPVPRSAAGEFLFLAGLGAAGIILLSGCIALLWDR